MNISVSSLLGMERTLTHNPRDFHSYELDKSGKKLYSSKDGKDLLRILNVVFV